MRILLFTGWFEPIEARLRPDPHAWRAFVCEQDVRIETTSVPPWRSTCALDAIKQDLHCSHRGGLWRMNLAVHFPTPAEFRQSPNIKSGRGENVDRTSSVIAQIWVIYRQANSILAHPKAGLSRRVGVEILGHKLQALPLGRHNESADQRSRADVDRPPCALRDELCLRTNCIEQRVLRAYEFNRSVAQDSLRLVIERSSAGNRF